MSPQDEEEQRAVVHPNYAKMNLYTLTQPAPEWTAGKDKYETFCSLDDGKRGYGLKSIASSPSSPSHATE